MKKISPLQKQLELTRLERAIEVAESLAEHRALLTTTELARLNQIITGQSSEPWRQSPVTITLPSGRTETLAVIADPVVMAREKLHRATELAEAGKPLRAAVQIYIDLVLSHVFADANRRTAVMASHYFFKRYGIPLSGTVIHDLGLGDLRQSGETEELYKIVEQMNQFASKRHQND